MSEMSQDNVTNEVKIVSNENKREKLEDVMKDLEQKVNPKTIGEGGGKLATSIIKNDPSILLNPMVEGAKEFEQRVGRPMTYSEMRMMWG